jgi:hypothetical protein
MNNPYEPSEIERSPEHSVQRLNDQPSFWGGYGLVFLVGLVGGSVTGLLLFFFLTSSYALQYLDTWFMVWVTPAIGLLAGILTIFGMVRSSGMSWKRKCVLSLVLTVPTYLLYVPLCTIGSTTSAEFSGRPGYAPTQMMVVSLSAITFSGLLLMVAFVVKGVLHGRRR